MIYVTHARFSWHGNCASTSGGTHALDPVVDIGGRRAGAGRRPGRLAARTRDAVRPPLTDRHEGRHHEWAFAGGLALFLCLLAMVAAMPAARPGSEGDGDTLPVRVELAQTSRADSAAQARGPLAEDRMAGTARLRFDLPPETGDGARWVLWLRRDPFDTLRLSASGWRPEARDFYRPNDDGGELPMAYVFPLPREWRGAVSLDVAADSRMRAVLQPQVVRESAMVRINQRALALVATVYASLFMLGLMSLALYAAARDRSFLAFSGFAVLGLLLLAAGNGHLYMLPGLSVLAAWRAHGIWALSAFFMVSALHVTLQFAGTASVRPRMTGWIERLCLALMGVGLLSLLNVQVMGGWLLALATAGWMLAGAAAVAVMYDAARRRVPMALSVLLLTCLTFLAALAREAAARGLMADMPWSRYGDQLALVGCAALIAVGLMGRIGEFRTQRDLDRSAREETERLMRLETARSGFAAALQSRLRSLDGGDIPAIAFKLLLEHVLPHVPAQAGAVAAKDYHGRDVLVSQPAARRPHFQDVLAERGLALRRLLANDAPLQQAAAMDGAAVQEFAVRVPVRAPAWAALVLHRAGAGVFTPEEISLAHDFARMAAAHTDQALAAIQLRRTAEVDALTGAVNRRAIDQALMRKFLEAERSHRPLSVLFVDLDHFKDVNDRYGHACGDECLRQVAQTLRQAIGEQDLLGRYGGEEFVAVLPGRDAAEAQQIGEALRLAVQRCAIDWEGTRIALSVSVGVATRHAHETDPGATLARADKALYAAKRYGRNCVQAAPAVFD